jgi:hypothetical protein
MTFNRTNPPLHAEFSANDGRVIGVSWRVFLMWLQDIWQPGQHMFIVAPTGEGKTTLAVPILELRKWVLALDPKGIDDTLAESGFTRVESLPLPRKMRNDIADGKPARIIIGGSARSDEDQEKLKRLMKQALKMAREHGGWTIYVDEFQILADRRMYGLDKDVELLLIAARRDRSSVVMTFQAPAWVPRAATRQARVGIIGPTRDRTMIKNVAESMGRDWRELSLIIDEIPSFYWIVIPKNVRAPVLLVHPPKL